MPKTDCKPLPTLSAQDIIRFWTKVDKTPGQGPKGDCWGWKDALTSGYGRFRAQGVGCWFAHRVAYMVQRGADPYPLLVCHSCDWPPCVRGEHFFRGSYKDNAADRETKGRSHYPRLYPYKEKQLRKPFRPIPALSPKIIRRFWEKVDVRAPDECWLWTGSSRDAGYGQCYVGRVNGKDATRAAHRVGFVLHYGYDPLDAEVCHRCSGDRDNPACVNGRHLYAGTATSNQLDATRRGRRIAQGETHYRAKLTAAEVMEILLSDQGSLPLSIRYGVSATTIQAIRARKIWKSIQVTRSLE